MDICRTTTHVVKQGDTFYKLAQQYKTTVPDIIRRNPGINPYNLQVGTRLNICEGMPQGNRPGWPGNRPVWPGNRPEMPGEMPMPEDELEVNNDMRKAWTEHAFWMMIYQNSIFNGLADVEDVAMRLMQNAEDLAAVYDNFYSGAIINQLTRLLMEYARLAGEIMVSMWTIHRIRNSWNASGSRMRKALQDCLQMQTQSIAMRNFYRHLPHIWIW